MNVSMMNPGDTAVLDCGNQIFVRPGLANVPEAALASVQSKIEAMLEQLVNNRVPAPAVLRLHQVCLAALISHHLIHLVLTGCLPGATFCVVFYLSHICFCTC